MVKLENIYFTKEEIIKEDRVRQVQKIIHWPSNTTFKFIIENQFIRNSCINVYDINRDNLMYGIVTPLLQSKIIRKTRPHVNIEHIPLPLPISEQHNYIHIYIELFDVKGFPFLHIKSGQIKFFSVQKCVSISKGKIIKGLEIMNKINYTRGFNVTSYRGGNEFNIEVMETALLSRLLSICARYEHIHLIDKLIQ